MRIREESLSLALELMGPLNIFFCSHPDDLGVGGPRVEIGQLLLIFVSCWARNGVAYFGMAVLGCLKPLKEAELTLD